MWNKSVFIHANTYLPRTRGAASDTKSPYLPTFPGFHSLGRTAASTKCPAWVDFFPSQWRLAVRAGMPHFEVPKAAREFLMQMNCNTDTIRQTISQAPRGKCIGKK